MARTSAAAAVVLVLGLLCVGGFRAIAADSGLDPAFGGTGTVVTDMGGSDDDARAVVIGADGTTTVVGEARPDEQHLRSFAISRYAPDGTPDATFGNDGRVFTAFGEFQGSGARAAALQPDGRLVVVGFGRHPEWFHDTFAVARYQLDGDLDPAFGNGGQVLTAIVPQTGAGLTEVANAVAIDAKGRIVVAGETGELFKDFAVVRYLPEGDLDPSFGEGGIVNTDLGGDDRANAIAVDSDGRILVAGSGWRDNGAEDFAIVRYLDDGTLDLAFGDGGIVTTDFRGGGDRAYGLAIRLDGSIALGGTVQLGGGCSPNACERYGFGVAQYDADGMLQLEFGDGGRVFPDFLTSAGGYAVALLDEGTLVVAGHFGNEDFGLLFVAPDGSILTVDSGDGVRIDFQGGMDRAFGVARAPDCSVVVAGPAGASDGSFDVGVARYRSPAC